MDMPCQMSRSSCTFKNLYPDFNASFIRYGRSYKLWKAHYSDPSKEAPPIHVKQKERCEALYNWDKKRSLSQSAEYKIPRIIHQIWLGSEVPQKYEEWIASWQNWSGWEYKLWSEKEVSSLNLRNAAAYASAKNFGEKSDILRYEILHQFGGIYVDTDVQCFNRDFFEFAHTQYGFFIGIEPIETCLTFCCGNALMASAPHHPMICKIIDNLEPYIHQHLNQDTIIKTGPRYISKTVIENMHLMFEDGIIFPPTFFYPIPVFEDPQIHMYKRPETAAVHYFDGSWAK